jgi:hypothetical protein
MGGTLILFNNWVNGNLTPFKAITLLNKYNEWLILNPNYILHQSFSPQHLITIIEKIIRLIIMIQIH